MAKEILLGVSGGVACYKAAIVCSKLVQSGYGVSVILTRSAGEFIGAPTFEALSGRPVSDSTFNAGFPLGPHIELARRADLLLVAPATANIIAKAAQGIADDLLSTTLLSFTGPVWFAPAMNAEMWSKPSVQRNVKQLREDGVEMIGPAAGWQSCRERGVGRMSEPQEIVAAIVARLGNANDSAV